MARKSSLGSKTPNIKPSKKSIEANLPLTFSAQVRRNQRLKALDDLIDGGRFHIDTKKLVEEIEALHTSRKSRSVKFASKSVISENIIALVAAHQDSMVIRSRIVAIKMECYKASYLLQQHIDALKPYIRDKYMDLLKKTYSTVGERNEAVEMCFRKPNQLISDMELVIELADFVVADIDSSGWSLKHIQDAFAVSAPKSHEM